MIAAKNRTVPAARLRCVPASSIFTARKNIAVVTKKYRYALYRAHQLPGRNRYISAERASVTLHSAASSFSLEKAVLSPHTQIPALTRKIPLNQGPRPPTRASVYMQAFTSDSETVNGTFKAGASFDVFVTFSVLPNKEIRLFSGLLFPENVFGSLYAIISTVPSPPASG